MGQAVLPRFAWSVPTASHPQPPSVPAVGAMRPAARTVLHSSASLPPALTDRRPPALATALSDALTARATGQSEIEEIRLRAGRYVTLTVDGENLTTDLRLDGDDLSDVLSALCGGSLYAYSQDIAQGFLTLPGGIRVGVAGRAACEEGRVLGLRSVTGLCIRLPHPHRSVGDRIVRLVRDSLAAGSPRGLLLYGAPGVGKTTLLRGVAVGLASPPTPLRTVLVDSRAELCYGTDDPGLCLDVLVGYPLSLIHI